MTDGGFDLYRDGSVAIGTDLARFGARQFLTTDISDVRCEREIETPHRFGNIVAATLFLVVMLGFLFPIQADLIGYKFYMGVGLFLLLALAAGDDILRSTPIVSHKLYLRTASGEVLAFVANEEGRVRRIEQAVRAALELAGHRNRSAAARLPTMANTH